MIMTMAEARARRNAKAAHYEGHGLHDYGSVGKARVALEKSGIRHPDLDPGDQADMAQWMWRNDASPEDAATAFGLKLPGE